MTSFHQNLQNDIYNSSQTFVLFVQLTLISNTNVENTSNMSEQKKITKTVKVPVRLADSNEKIRKTKYKALDKVMREAKYLGNMAIRYAIAFSLKNIPDEINPETGEEVPIDTRIYRILSEERRYLPSACTSTLGRNYAGKLFRNSDRDAWAGKKSLPAYKSNFLPFRHNGTKLNNLVQNGIEQFTIVPDGFSGKWLTDELIIESGGTPKEFKKENKKLTFVSNFSWKDKGSAEVVKKICVGKYKLKDSIVKKTYKNMIMFFLTYSFEKDKTILDPKKVCGIDLGVVVPAVCAVNFGPQREYIGQREDVWAARSKFRAQRRREQKRAGLYSKTKQWKRSNKENNWIHTTYHTYTRQAINFCLNNKCRTIIVEDLSDLRKDDSKNEYKRIMWIPSKFQTMLQYKADELGIKVLKIPPQYTSLRCSACGNISKKNRISQSKFLCEKCGDPKKPVSADYNAAKNIASAEGDVLTDGYSWEELQEDKNP